MNIVKVLGVVVGIHVVAYLVIAQPGCRSTAVKPAPEPAPQPARAVAYGEPAAAVAAEPALVSLNLPLAEVPAGDRFAPTRPGAEPAPVASTPAKTYTVQKGDSFYTIARRNGVTVAELTAANNLAKNATIRPGQKLVIPGQAVASTAAASGVRSTGPAAAAVAGGATYTVKSGDTLSKIASRHRTTTAALRSLNGISGDHLRIGQVLQLPGNGVAAAPTPSLPPPASAQPTTVVSSAPAPAGPGVHTVAAGESAESIARRYQISVGELVRANQITDPRRIRIGQVLTIPGAAAANAARPPPSLVPEVEPFPAEPAPAEPAAAEPVAPDAPVIRIDEPPAAVPAE